MTDQLVSLDIISTLPQNIKETILCLLPIQEAARTSILSSDWRYSWLTIPKLEFTDLDFEVTTDKNQLSVLEQNFGSLSQRKQMTKRCKMFYAIHQILLVHRGPIHEFSLTMDADNSCVEIDQIILHLLRHYTINKFKIKSIHDRSYRVPLSIHSLHQLTEVHLCRCYLDHHPTKINGFGALTRLYMDDVVTTTKTLLCLVSNSPLLKSFTLINSYYEGNFNFSWDTICQLFKCLHMIEHLTISYSVIEWLNDGMVPRELPSSLIRLKYFCFQDMCFVSNNGLPFLVLLLKSSPKLEKIKISIWHSRDSENSEIDSVTLEDYSDVWLEHLKELEIENFKILKPELEFVKLILAKSPVLKKMSIVLDYVTKTKELKMLRSLLCFTRASPLVRIMVKGKNVV